MKIKPEHLAIIRERIAAIYVNVPSVSYYEGRPHVKDPAKRRRWDAAYLAKLSTFFNLEVYRYADDDHIDTALRVVMAELDAAKTPAVEPFPQVPVPTSPRFGEHLTTAVATPANGPTGLRMAAKYMRHDLKDQRIMLSFTGVMDCTWDAPNDRRNALAYVGISWED